MKRAAKESKRGRAVNLYLNPVDEAKIAELRLHITAEGYRVTDSQIVKAALRVAQTDNKFLKAFQDVRASDPRRKENR